MELDSEDFSFCRLACVQISYPFIQFKFSIVPYTYTHYNAVTLVWGSLGLAPIIIANFRSKFCYDWRPAIHQSFSNGILYCIAHHIAGCSGTILHKEQFFLQLTYYFTLCDLSVVLSCGIMYSNVLGSFSCNVTAQNIVCAQLMHTHTHTISIHRWWPEASAEWNLQQFQHTWSSGGLLQWTMGDCVW